MQSTERIVQGRLSAKPIEGGSPPNVVSKSDLQFWKATLAGAPPLLELPTDRPRPSVVSYAGGRVPVVLTAELSAGIRRLSQRHGTTSFVTLLSAWSILLARLTQRRDIVIGTPVPNHGRNDIDPLSGCSTNTLALRVRLTQEQRVADLLLQIKASTSEAFAHQDVPLMEIVDALELPCDLSYHPIFQVMLVLDDASAEELDGDLDAEQVNAKFDLALALTDTGKNISGFLEYASDLFERSTILHMTVQLQAVFEAMIADDRQYLGAPTLLSQNAGQRPLTERPAPAAETDARAELDGATRFMAATQQRRQAELVAASSSGTGDAAVADEHVEPMDGNAASSASVLGHIRDALERIGAIQDPLNAAEPAHLLMRLDGKTAVWHVLGKRTTIGRTAENDVRVDADFISRHHAVVLRDGADTVIEDLKSTNGTYVNGERISRRRLKGGDVVALGTMEFHFSVNS